MTKRTLLAALLALPAHAAAPGWITSCQFSHSLPDDPIVFFAQPGASHLHDFAGAKNTNANSTSDSLRSVPTTCLTKGDNSAYWVPALYRNGERVLPVGTSKHALFYYRRVAAPSGTTVARIPDGLKMIVGNPHAESPAENPRLGRDIIWKCGPGSGTNLAQPPTQCSSGIMVASLRFPNCWNGKDLDSPDHISHMSYPVSGRCPASHPVNMPRIESFFRYPVGTGDIGTISLSSGPWYTIHQDFFNAWVPADLAFLMQKCINGGLDCGKNPVVP